MFSPLAAGVWSGCNRRRPAHAGPPGRRAQVAALLGLAQAALAASGQNAPDAPTFPEVARQLNHAFIQITEKVSRSVVVIRVVHREGYTGADDFSDSWFDRLPPQFRRFFEDSGEAPPTESPEAPPPRRAPRPPGQFDGQGSGIIIREDGYILTNSHVIDGAERITVRFKDGREFKATVRGRDEKSDIAVIKIEANDLPAARLGDSSKTRVGELAIAIGAPFELDYSVTFGHVSAKGRSGVIPTYAGGGSMDQDFLQTDASINPGNSGGPLVNLEGEVIGINTLIRGMNRGIGFAVPINLAREVADELIAAGRFTRAWLGVGIRDLRDYPEYRRWLGAGMDGVVVESIQPTGPAAKSSLQPADIIVEVDGRKVAHTQDLRDEIRSKAGKTVAVRVLRGGDETVVNVALEPWPEEAGGRAAKAALEPAPPLTNTGIKVKPAGGADATGSAGVVVAEIAANSLAAQRGLRPGDLITHVNHGPVASPAEFDHSIQNADLKRGVLINFLRGGAKRFEILSNAVE